MDDGSNDSTHSTGTDSRIPYFELLNTLANDLDFMLNDLYTTPPSTLRMSGDTFLEPYMQGLANDSTNDDSGEIDTDDDGAGTGGGGGVDGDAYFNVFEKGLRAQRRERRPQCRRPSDGVADERTPTTTTSSFSSPVTSLDTPLNDKHDLDFRLGLSVVDGPHGVGSECSLNRLIGGDDECSGSSSESFAANEETACDITLLERLIRSHPIWFLPGILRAGAFHLLQGKEDGNFVVRQSSQNSTMAISVRLPSGKGPYIEHYLIQAYDNGHIGLESSDNKFSSIPLLVAHYCQCCDELPVQLTLPRAIREAKNRQQLSSLALLGQEFWRYPMANPRQTTITTSPNDGSAGGPLPTALPCREGEPSDGSSHNRSGSLSSSSNSPASSLSSFDSSNNNNLNSSPSILEHPSNVVLFDADLTNGVSSKESPYQAENSMITFKSSPPFNSVSLPFGHNQLGIPVARESPSSLPIETSQTHAITARKPRPTPPNTLNLISTTSPTIAKNSDNRDVENNEITSPNAITAVSTPTNKTPPPPPPRWTKPTFVGGVVPATAQNYTVSTTLTLTVNKDKSCSNVDTRTSTFQTSTSPHNHDQTKLTVSLPTIPPTPLPRSNIPLMGSPAAATTTTTTTTPTSQILSPVSEGNTRPFHRRTRRHKQSHHYQESNIIESYHRSTVADKVSDYEDIWGTDCSLSTFKPQPPPRSLPPFTIATTEEFSSKLSTKMTVVSPTSPFVDNVAAVATSSPVVDNKSSSPAAYNEEDIANGNVPYSVTEKAETEAIPSTPDSKSTAAATTTTTTPPPRENNEPENKLNSPFYADPADAIKETAAAYKKRTKSNVTIGSNTGRNRHSDPSAFHQWPAAIVGGGLLERIDSKEELITNGSLSSSVDNLVGLKNSRRKNAATVSSTAKCAAAAAKPIEPPKLTTSKSKGGADVWAIDTNWEYMAKEADLKNANTTTKQIGRNAKSGVGNGTVEEDDTTNKNDGGNVARKLESADDAEDSDEKRLTVQEMVFEKLPELRLSPVLLIGKTNVKLRGSKSEKTNKNESNETIQSVINNNTINDTNNNANNGEKIYYNGISVLSQISDTSDDTQTEFSEPWDSSQWEQLLGKGFEETATEENANHVNRCKSFKERLDPLLSPSRLKALAKTRETTTVSPGATIREYALKLAADKETVFAKTIDHFISCTIESKETKPQVVMRNMRQFMSGMKNYLVTHGEGEFIKQVDSERSKLKSTEFLNLDAILENVMHKLVISPLKRHLCQLFVSEYETNGALKILVENIKYARTKPPSDLGIKDKIILPTDDDLKTIANFFARLQEEDSPFEKLQYLLKAISTIFHSIKENNQGREAIFIGADDFLPIFVWVLVQTGMVAAEVEAEYMWGLLHPSLLSGEGGYYLTTLSSAVNVLKNFRRYRNGGNDVVNAIPSCFDPLSEFKCVLKVVVPNELNGSLLTKTLPVRPNMTTKDICKIIASRLKITNPQDFSLFKLVDGEETQLNETDCPQDLKSELAKGGKHCSFAYKRIDAKIAWPRISMPCN